MFHKLALLFVLAALGASAQTTTFVVPDCSWSFTATATGRVSTTGFNNTTSRCTVFALVWEVFGATPTVTATLQQAPSNTAGTAPGTWITYAGTTAIGNNPSSAVNNTFAGTGGAAWFNLNVTALGSGATLRGTLFGWRAPGNVSSGGGGGPSTNVVVTNTPLPVDIVQSVPLDVAIDSCATNQSAFDISASGNTQIIAISGSLTPVICSISFLGTTITNWKITRGTGTNCGTGTTDVTGTYGSSFGGAFDWATNPVSGAAGSAICLNFSANPTAGGVVLYRYQ